ncbi:MAG: protein phosphatase 2C domain-containing protein [Actinomycetota bacterium]|nr:protein phosphatase 2C domain-containing protein [Actinomycetota bacterium]MDQ3627291.1 protein phosphatase 2C domain-containing protein [Actinomycetota bacterium]
MTITLRYSALSDVGRVRKNNEDSGYASARLLLLADGMGGMEAGEVASSVTVQTLRKVDEPPNGDLLEVLAGAVQRANDRLAEIIDADASVEGMGTTVTGMLSDGERIALVHIGDSRAYRLRKGQLEQLTRDHTFVQSLIDEGRLTRDEAKVHPHRSVLIRALDGRQELEPDLSVLDLVAGDRVLLCSDGVTDFLPDVEIEQLLEAPTVDSAAVDIVRASLARGSNDNVTVVVADVVDVGDEPVAAEDPMIFGAAAEEPRPRSVHDSDVRATRTRSTPADGEDDPQAARDPEELRYAPRAPLRFTWLRRLVVIAIVLALVGLGLKLTYDWTQRQYYVGASQDRVVIFRGIDQRIPGIALTRVEVEYDIALDSLPSYLREDVENGIGAEGLEHARRIVGNLQDDIDECSRPNPDPEQCEGAEPSDPAEPSGPSPSRPTEPSPSEPGPTGPTGGAGQTGGDRP